MAEVTIKFENDEMYYDANECDARQFSAIINASIHQLETEFMEKGEDLTQFLTGIRRNLEMLENRQGTFLNNLEGRK